MYFSGSTLTASAHSIWPLIKHVLCPASINIFKYRNRMQDSGFNLTCWDNCEKQVLCAFVSCPSCARAQRQAEVQVAQVPEPAGWQGHAEDFCFPCQCLHAAVRPKRQEARVLVRCSFWEVSAIPSLAELHFKCPLPVLLKWNCLLIQTQVLYLEVCSLVNFYIISDSCQDYRLY